LLFDLLLRRVVTSHLVVIIVDVLEHVVAGFVRIRDIPFHGHVLGSGVAVLVVECVALEIANSIVTLFRLTAGVGGRLRVGPELVRLGMLDAHPILIFPLIVQVVLGLFTLRPHVLLLSVELMVTHLAARDASGQLGAVLGQLHQLDSACFLVSQPSKSICHHGFLESPLLKIKKLLELH